MVLQLEAITVIFHFYSRINLVVSGHMNVGFAGISGVILVEKGACLLLVP
jgi:hypothetical protein